MSRKVDHTFGKSLRDLLKPKALEPRPLKDLYAFQVVFNKLDRVGDQAENLCEETLFAVEGLRKLPRTFEIVFVDDRDDCATQMARALCEKLYPDRGRYHSAGWQPAESVNPLLNEIADELGLDLDDSEPEQLVVKRKKLRKFNVLVSLDGDPLEHIDNLPFLVTVVRWELHSPDLNGEPEHDRVALRSLYTELSARIGDLMEVLCGKECR